MHLWKYFNVKTKGYELLEEVFGGNNSTEKKLLG
jgi:hypothetical protein